MLKIILFSTFIMAGVAQAKYFVAAQGGLNCRKSETRNSAWIQTLPNKREVKVLGKGPRGWFKVECKKGVFGYIAPWYVRKAKSVSEIKAIPRLKKKSFDQKQVNFNKGTLTVSTRALRCREEPGRETAQGRQVKTLSIVKFDQKLKYDAEFKADGLIWKRVKCGGRTGYVAKMYTEDGKKELESKASAKSPKSKKNIKANAKSGSKGSFRGVGFINPVCDCKGPKCHRSSNYGYRRHPILGYRKHHGGVDVAAPRGTPIIAAAPGKVTFASRAGNAGIMVNLNHKNRVCSRYLHMSKIAPGIRPGVQVKAGQLIGYVGSTGGSTGPHLHYEIRYGNGRDCWIRSSRPVNPNNYVKFNRSLHKRSCTPKRSIRSRIATKIYTGER